VAETEERFEVVAPGGAVQALFQRGNGSSLVVLAHGAGSHFEHRTVERLAGVLSADASVLRFNFLYRAQGRGMPDRMPVLTETYAVVVEEARRRWQPERLVVGGHSMGGRAASMMAAEGFPCDGLLLFGYPLHPAGKPERLRDAHLPHLSAPTLCVNGTEDSLCTRSLMEAVLAKVPATFQMHWVEGADHSFGVKRSSGRTAADVWEEIGDVARGWLRRR
jgi:uncharacterized protein